MLRAKTPVTAVYGNPAIPIRVNDTRGQRKGRGSSGRRMRKIKTAAHTMTNANSVPMLNMFWIVLIGVNAVTRQWNGRVQIVEPAVCGSAGCHAFRGQSVPQQFNQSCLRRECMVGGHATRG